ncbi:PREDICTED: uncharacterized protein LOC105362401 [Ceratosolen solmsi marchali]|uniref:Uncharacterized protein LOC105362401 n=1 Tax=Ceratosolen solmsi marchali TaxID=326594 RepID=A0AAJ6YHH0_9HYME|nr:PREDICTED: uncharacterized protein LOC105362401 [Ceratosolen solmsi marchali]
MRWDAAACCYWLAPLLLLLSLDLTNLASAFLETKGCNRTVRNSVGWIRWTGRMGRCIVRIRAPLRDPQVIEMRIRRMQVGILKNARCEGAYVQFSDEVEDLDESAGRYCGHVTGDATRLFLRRGPDLTVILDSESRFAAENPVIFSAQFSILPAQLANERHHVHQPTSAASTLAAASAAECPLECSQRNDRRACRLVSPGYPGIYPRGIRCRVALESSAGRFRIGGTPNDLYNLMNHTSQEACRSEFCEQEHVDDAEKPSADQPKGQGILRNPPRAQTDRDEEDEIIIGQEEQSSETSTTEIKMKKKQQQRRTRGQQQQQQQRRVPGTDNPRKQQQQQHQHQQSVRMRHGGGQHRRQGEKIPEPDGRSISELSKLRRIPVVDQLFWSKNRSHTEHPRGSQHDRRHVRLLRRRRPHDVSQPRLGSGGNCVGDYLALLESVNGRVLEIGKFCGEGRIPQILSRGRNVIVEFHAERDGTIMHDGFHLSLEESEAPPVATALASPASGHHQPNCDFIYKSSEKPRDSIKSPRSWYPPNTLCSYRFSGKPNERVSVLLKIVRADQVQEEDSLDEDKKQARRNETLDYCPGNEITVYNGTHSNGSFLLWSFCDVTHSDINNIQVPIISTGNALLIQFFSAIGSYSGQDFTYSITYKFARRSANATKRRQVSLDETRLISLRPVNFSALNLSDTDNCNCDFADRIGSFKSWFIVLVVLGVISFVGAILTIIALLVKCAKMRAAENKLLQTPKRSPFFKGSTD